MDKMQYNSDFNKTEEKNRGITHCVAYDRKVLFYDLEYSGKRLMEAIIWSELLGKPVCKRRKRRYYGD